MDEHNGILLPPGAAASLPGQDGGHAVVINETGLPDEQIKQATQSWFLENASVNGLAQTPSTFGVHSANQGSLLARTEYRTPTNIIEEIKLARELAERDDDIASVIGSMIALAFGEGMENFHDDERTVSIFNTISREMNLDRVLREMYREYLISYQINTVSLFTRGTLEYSMVGSNRQRSDSIAWPLVGIMPAENIRIIGNDMFGNGTLGAIPESEAEREWLDEFFDPKTTPARKHDMAVKDRVMAAMYTGYVELTPQDIYADPDLVTSNNRIYTLNPRIVHRTTGPKGAWKYPRPLLTRNFALLEAKRLLNLMDYALLQGGANFVVVAKKGSDQRPAQPAELENLREVVRHASRSGVIVGDHRLTFDVITPDLSELLNAEKRKLIGRKLARGLLRLPELDQESGSEGARLDAEFIQRIVGNDRHEIKRHVERTTYVEIAKRNGNRLGQGHPALWFPKIILQGTNYFNDLVLKLRDRGDIPRAWATSAAGFPWAAAVQQRKREVEAGDDDVMLPAQVPFNSPAAGPQDNNQGRPAGGRDDRPRQRVTQNAGETVRAMYVEELASTVRIGDITQAILDEHPDYEHGRVSRIERELLDGNVADPTQRATTMYVPVNPGYECAEYQAVNLTPNLRLIIGDRKRDRAKVAKLVCFREGEYDEAAAESTVIRWGFPVRMPEEEAATPVPGSDPEELAEALGNALSKMPAPVVNVEVTTAGKTKKTVQRDPETGEIIGSTEEPVE